MYALKNIIDIIYFKIVVIEQQIIILKGFDWNNQKHLNVYSSLHTFTGLETEKPWS